MNSNECWFGRHEACTAPEFCDCLCHVTLGDDEWPDEPMLGGVGG